MQESNNDFENQRSDSAESNEILGSNDEQWVHYIQEGDIQEGDIQEGDVHEGDVHEGDEPVSVIPDLPTPLNPTPLNPVALNPVALNPVALNPVAQAPDGSSIFSKFSWLLAVGFVFVGAWYLGPGIVERYEYSAARGRMRAHYEAAKSSLADQPLGNISTASEMVAAYIRPSVVHINTKSRVEMASDSNGQYGRQGRGQRAYPNERPRIYESEGQGSGVLMSTDGYIITNQHVIAGTNSITISLSDRREFPARVVGIDTKTDLAVLKIDADDLTPARWGDSDELNAGAWVWAVGSPFGLEQSISGGLVSAKHRRTSQNPYQDLLQSDVAVNPGNSGGPLVNSSGEVIGINTSIVGEVFQGISFAVPSVVAKDIFERIRDDGIVERGFLGVEPGVVTHELKKKFGLPSLDGAVVNRVEPGSPADQEGLLPGDVIVRWNNKPIENDILLFREVGMTRVKSTAEVAVLRGGKELTLFISVAKNEDL